MKNRDSINIWSYSTSISHRKECKSVILIWTVNDLSVRNPRKRNIRNAKSQIDNPSPVHLILYQPFKNTKKEHILEYFSCLRKVIGKVVKISSNHFVGGLARWEWQNWIKAVRASFSKCWDCSNLLNQREGFRDLHEGHGHQATRHQDHHRWLQGQVLQRHRLHQQAGHMHAHASRVKTTK